MYKILQLLLLGFSLLLISCSNNSSNSSSSPSSNGDASESADNQNSSTETSDDQNSGETSLSGSGCNFEDGTYSATVDYYNPETGYSATYDLDVEVQDCQVIQINFPNDGYLDEDHITAGDIDEDGNASVDGENGKTYEIQINQ